MVPILLSYFVVCLLFCIGSLWVSTMLALLCGQEIPRGTPSRLHFWCQCYKGLPRIKTAFVLIYFLFLVLLVFQAFHETFLWFWNVCMWDGEWVAQGSLHRLWNHLVLRPCIWNVMIQKVPGYTSWVSRLSVLLHCSLNGTPLFPLF